MAPDVHRPARRCACRAAQFRVGAQSFTKLVCPCALGKTEANRLPRHETILLVDTLIWRPVAEIRNETAARNFEEQVERDLPGRLRRPRARSVRQSLVC